MTLARRDLVGLWLLIACSSEQQLIDETFFVDPVDVLPCGFTPLSGRCCSNQRM